MPDGWWDEQRAGQHRSWHRLAAWRELGDLDDVQSGGTPRSPGEDDFANFGEGAVAVACPPDPAWLVLCAAAEWHHSGGDIAVWGTGPDVAGRLLLDGRDFHDEALDVQVSPDGSVAVASVEGRLHAWRTPGGDALWQLDLGPVAESVDTFDMPRMTPRIGFSGDGRLVAAGSVARGLRVIDAGTGDIIVELPVATCGPVALDHAGRLLAHGGEAGGIVVRDADTGTVRCHHDTGLSTVNALAFAPDGSGLLVAGGAPEAPAAVLLTLDADRVAYTRLVLAEGLPPDISAQSPLAAVATRCVWGEHGPLVLAVDDGGAVLFDAAGRLLWTGHEGTVGGFSPAGDVLAVVGETIGTVFIEGLRATGPDVVGARP
ncbi:WD40 repeat domain-containing protein [Catellatospora vulcania]|uniref:WD40 repeat domain-containing protein n=1 Tax=Catellatospora vulcania TaxID=1460450 RepID=UPI0012D4B26B|nr:WD40 repeat domain-containing protein [Catellatospora vulcania]